MGSKRTCSKERCPECRIHKYLCFCKDLESVVYPTEVFIIMHKAETFLTSNTATLAHKSLPNSKLQIRGLKDSPLLLENFIQDEKLNLVLFPTEDSISIDEFNNDTPKRLIVPDGSWSQAKSIVKREELLKNAIKVKIPKGKRSEYFLRTEPNDESVSTFEAISRALARLHPEISNGSLEKNFKIMIERNLWAKSMINENNCTYPIPAKALEYRYRPHLFKE